MAVPLSVPRAASGAVQASWLDNQALNGPAHQLHLDEPLLLDGGRALPEYIVNFETYGTLSAARDNAILVCHSLTSRAHAAGRHAPDDPQPGWWDAAIGPGKMLDTARYFVICTDALGAGQSTGPASPDPETGRRYGVRFPVITVRDMVRAQHRLVQRLGIDRLHAVIGGCMGGQQALEWAITYPAMVGNAVVITTTPATSAHTIAIFSVMRHLIRADPDWNAGDYYGRSVPVAGLGAAVAAAVPLWMSREAMEAKFGRRSSGYRYTLGPEFEVESFIARLVAQARHDIDPNGLMYLMRAVEYFDLEREYGDLEAAFRPVSARVLFVSYRRDWRYPAAEAERMREAITAVRGGGEAGGGDARHAGRGFGVGHPGWGGGGGGGGGRCPAPRAGQRHGSWCLPLRPGRPGGAGLRLSRRPTEMTGTMTVPTTGEARVWDALCRHIDGMAIGTTIAALHERGALAMLAARDRTDFGPLREKLAANAGFLHVAMRLLADQGWVARSGEPGTDEMTIAPTPRGRVVMTALAGAYPAAVRSLPAQVNRDPGPFGPLMRREWGLPASVPPDARHQVLAHLNGHLVAPVMCAVSSGEADIATSRGAAEILAAAGWARLDGKVPGLTPDGEIAVSLARQYRYPVMYLPLLRQVPELIFGEPAKTDDGGEESHLDRELDLRFSGDVFAAACREPFLRIALPLFEAAPLDRQPALVVDAGCGDGTLLETLYRAVRERTERGQRLAERPLLMVGVDPSPVARRMASARLSGAGVPHLILDGDIGDPAGLERTLAARGLDARDALHVCKSAIHDRAYEGPGPWRPASPRAGGVQQGDVPPAGVPPAGAGAYALPDGSALPASSVALDLAALFRRWLPVARRHGWLVIEAHAVPAAILAGLIGRTHATVLDATHGYACQYPVEPGVFAWAARAGGFVSRQHAEPGAATFGHTILTIDHFVAAGPT